MTAHVAAPGAVVRFAGRITEALGLGDRLVGVYLHGSAVLGGFVPGRSDVDLLVVVTDPLSRHAQRDLGEAVVAAADPCPGAGLELSVITAATAASLGTCPFEVHVNTTGGDATVVPGAGHAGDPDLVLHAAVCRLHGLPVAGPPPDRVFGRVSEHRILRALDSELEWAVANRSLAYAVLNACRARRFAAEGVLCSKIDAGEWMRSRRPDLAVVAEAVAQQRDGVEVRPLTAEASELVADTRVLLAREISGARQVGRGVDDPVIGVQDPVREADVPLAQQGEAE